MGTSFAKGLSTEYIFLEFHLSMDITSIQISTVGIWISMMKIGITVSSYARGTYVCNYI